MTKPNADRLPPLTALRAFEAAARHLSFAQAAAELHVTPAALSQQIKSLESHLGAPVFRRLNRKVELTDIGKTLVPGLQNGFGALKSAWSGALRRLSKHHLTVTAGPAFMASWLAPRMGGFVMAHPDIELSLTASLRMLSFERDEIDVAIRFGGGGDDGYFSEDLFTEWSTPMVAPKLAETLQQPSDIFKLPMIVQDGAAALACNEKWHAWCAVFGLDANKGQGPVFSTPDAALNYAANGGGVILGRISLAEHLLNSNRLVMPLAHSIRRDLRYRLVCPKGVEETPNVLVFRDWLRSEFRTFTEWEAGRNFI